MELFSSVLHGSYAYLLVFQILVVASLCLLLLWLVVQRTKEGMTEIAMHADGSAQMMMGDVTAASHADISALEAQLHALQEENQLLKGEPSDGKALQDKIKFLESKLLEYEILQEEIGTLGHLKNENEKLKESLVKAEAEIAKILGKAPATTTSPEDVAEATAAVDALANELNESESKS